MQDTSSIQNYDTLIKENYSVETKVVIDGIEYGEDDLQSLKTSKKAFDTDNPSVGHALAGQIELTMLEPAVTIPKGALIQPYIRIYANVKTSGNVARAGHAIAGLAVVGTLSETVYSGWLPKGLYYIASRDIDEENDLLSLFGYDVMRKADMVYPASSLTWSSSSPNARAVLEEIAGFMGIALDDRTKSAIPTNTTYIVGFPADYTLREVLASIGAMYGGNFCISDEGKLLYVGLTDIPTETYYLSTEDGDYITIGGTRILLKG